MFLNKIEKLLVLTITAGHNYIIIPFVILGNRNTFKLIRTGNTSMPIPPTHLIIIVKKPRHIIKIWLRQS